MLEAVEVAQFGHQGGGVEQRHAAQGHQGPHGRFPAPAGHGPLNLLVVTFQPRGGIRDDVEHLLEDDLLGREGQFDFGQVTQVSRGPRGFAAVTQVMTQQEHLELLTGAVLGFSHLEAGANQVPNGLILGIGHVDAGQLAGAEQAGQLLGIAAVGFDPVAGFARHFGGGHDDAGITQPTDEAAEGIASRTGFVTELEDRPWMSGCQLFDELEHVIMLTADDAVGAHLGGTARCDGHGDGIVVDVHADVEDEVC